MKLKAIAAIFSKNKHLILMDAPDGEQWISNGVAVYSLRGMPRMTPEAILRIFDVAPDKAKDWHCEAQELPTGIPFDDYARGETDIEPAKILIGWNGDGYTLFPDERKIYTIKTVYLKPLLDEPDYLTYHKRQTEGGGFVLAVKIGMEIKAVICPVLLHCNDKYVHEVRKIATLYRLMRLENVFDAIDEMTRDAAATQPPKADPETGEVIEGEDHNPAPEQTKMEEE